MRRKRGGETGEGIWIRKGEKKRNIISIEAIRQRKEPSCCLCAFVSIENKKRYSVRSVMRFHEAEGATITLMNKSIDISLCAVFALLIPQPVCKHLSFLNPSTMIFFMCITF